MSEIETQPYKRCWSCRSKIPTDAKICTKCEAYQDWRRHLSTTNIVAAALVSVIALISPLKDGFEYLWNLCCASKTLSSSMVQPLTLTNYEVARRLQVSKLSGAVAITNKSGKDAVISAALVEHIASTQTYFAEGCGYKELPNIVVKTGGGVVVIPFEMEYWVLIAEQGANFETIFSTEKFNLYMRGAGQGMKEDVARDGNVLLLWTDGTGSNRRAVVKGRAGAFSERSIKYPGTEAEFKQGGFSNPYCFSNEARKRVGIEMKQLP
jgi:hypothetical protein